MSITKTFIVLPVTLIHANVMIKYVVVICFVQAVKVNRKYLLNCFTRSYCCRLDGSSHDTQEDIIIDCNQTQGAVGAVADSSVIAEVRTITGMKLNPVVHEHQHM